MTSEGGSGTVRPSGVGSVLPSWLGDVDALGAPAGADWLRGFAAVPDDAPASPPPPPPDQPFDGAKALATIASGNVSFGDLLAIARDAESAGVVHGPGTPLGDALIAATPRASENGEQPLLDQLEHGDLRTVIQVVLGTERQRQLIGIETGMVGTRLGNAAAKAFERASADEHERLMKLFTDPALVTDTARARLAVQTALGMEQQAALMGVTDPAGGSFAKNTPLGTAMEHAFEVIAAAHGDPNGYLKGFANGWAPDPNVHVPENLNALRGLFGQLPGMPGGVGLGSLRPNPLTEALKGMLGGSGIIEGGTGGHAGGDASGSTGAPGLGGSGDGSGAGSGAGSGGDAGVPSTSPFPDPSDPLPSGSGSGGSSDSTKGGTPGQAPGTSPNSDPGGAGTPSGSGSSGGSGKSGTSGTGSDGVPTGLGAGWVDGIMAGVDAALAAHPLPAGSSQTTSRSTSTVIFPDSDGMEIQASPPKSDGQLSYQENADGSHSYVDKNGVVRYEVAADGTVTKYDAEGNVISVTPPPAKTTSEMPTDDDTAGGPSIVGHGAGIVHGPVGATTPGPIDVLPDFASGGIGDGTRTDGHGAGWGVTDPPEPDGPDPVKTASAVRLAAIDAIRGAADGTPHPWVSDDGGGIQPGEVPPGTAPIAGGGGGTAGQADTASDGAGAGVSPVSGPAPVFTVAEAGPATADTHLTMASIDIATLGGPSDVLGAPASGYAPAPASVEAPPATTATSVAAPVQDVLGTAAPVTGPGAGQDVLGATVTVVEPAAASESPALPSAPDLVAPDLASSHQTAATADAPSAVEPVHPVVHVELAVMSGHEASALPSVADAGDAATVPSVSPLDDDV